MDLVERVPYSLETSAMFQVAIAPHWAIIESAETGICTEDRCLPLRCMDWIKAIPTLSRGILIHPSAGPLTLGCFGIPVFKYHELSDWLKTMPQNIVLWAYED